MRKQPDPLYNYFSPQYGWVKTISCMDSGEGHSIEFQINGETHKCVVYWYQDIEEAIWNYRLAKARVAREVMYCQAV